MLVGIEADVVDAIHAGVGPKAGAVAKTRLPLALITKVQPPPSLVMSQ